MRSSIPPTFSSLSIVFAACLALAGVAGPVAQAQRGHHRHHRRHRHRRGRAAEQAAPQEAPRSEAIAPALAPLHWGMSKDEVMNHFIEQVKKRYRKKMAKVHDAVEEDRLLHEMRNQIQKIRASYVRFEGQSTGWDVSFLRDEYTHGNGESMFVYEDERAKNFFFFFNDRLWKWYRAFKEEVFGGVPFERFAQALEAKFGPALHREGPLHPGGEPRRWLEWQDDKTRLRAIDNTSFYGFYCLVFEDKGTLRRLEELRRNTRRPRHEGHRLVDSVVETPGGDEQEGDANADIVDRITGHIRRRPDRQEGD